MMMMMVMMTVMRLMMMMMMKTVILALANPNPHPTQLSSCVSPLAHTPRPKMSLEYDDIYIMVKCLCVTKVIISVLKGFDRFSCF